MYMSECKNEEVVFKGEGGIASKWRASLKDEGVKSAAKEG